jgi:hypothetical protein
VIFVATASAIALPGRASSTDTLAGSAGTQPGLPMTSSAVTVQGRGDFSGLTVTVNQTAQLENQAISVTWKGGAPTYSPLPSPAFSGIYGGDYLQIMQCWGDDDGTVPTNPGPSPTQCEFGGESQNKSFYPLPNSSFAYSRTLATSDWTCSATSPADCLSYTDAKALPAAQATTAPWGIVYLPFNAVDGTAVPLMVNQNYGATVPFSNFNVNPYFDHNDTNEVDVARTFPDGTGEATFQVDTGEESPGLGCGQSVEPQAGGTTKVPKCWLVIVPRSTGDKENPDGDPATGVVDTSPLGPTAWRNRIAIPLSFNPLATSCVLGSAQRRVVGGELAALASASWQPSLCAQNSAVSYTYESLDDSRVRSLITEGSDPSSGLGVVSQPADPTTVDPTNPPSYAPIALSGVVIGMNIDRRANLGPDGNFLPSEEALAGTIIQHVDLTPRLVAKLLTQSYKGAFIGPTGYSWLTHNPGTIYDDPDFKQFNPEFAELLPPNALNASQAIVEERSADANALLWQWILSDPEAKSFLDGTPDPFGMKVNPYYSTNPSVNPAGAGTPTGAPDNFSKADPYCYDSGIKVGSPLVPARPLCVLDWWPYVGSMHDAATATLSTNTGSHTSLNPSATSGDTAWSADGPEGVGQAVVLSVTDTADAARYGLETAALSRAGDDTAGRTFVAADTPGLKAGAAAMKPSAVQGVLSPDPSTSAAGAYPLTELSYAMVVPGNLDAGAAGDYAAFIKYAATTGQTPGLDVGDLPPGYAPLPSSMVSQAQAVATALTTPPTTSTTSTSTTSTTSTTAPPAPAPAPAPPPASTRAAARAPAPAPAPAPSPTAPPAPAPAPAPAAVALAPALPAAQTAPAPRTARSPLGVIRFAVPLALVFGLVAAGGASVPSVQRRLRKPTG